MEEDFNKNIENNQNTPENYQPNFQMPLQQQFTDYQQPVVQENQAVQQQNLVNEVAYYPVDNEPPKKKKKKGKKLLNAVLAIVCVFVISFGSIAGYVAATGDASDIPLIGTFFDNSDSDSNKKADKDSDDKAKDNKKNKNLPSLLQMAGRENALSIPEIVKKVTPSVVGISSKLTQGTSTGTGIIMTADGYIITNGHVVEGATQITVVISNSEKKLDEVNAKLIGIDAKTDLAVIKVDKTGLTPAEFGKSEDLQVGELAIAIGNPLGFELAGSVTGGIISALNREITIEDKQFTLIQTDAAINPGNSGGPLVNSYGQVIGINSAKISTAYAEGLGFAIPIDGAKPIIDSLIQYGYVKGRPMLGVNGEEITAVVARYYSLPEGILVKFIEEGSGAEKAGIQNGDVIISIDGKAIKTMAELNKIKDTHKAGETVKIGLYRKGKNIEVDVVLAEATK